MPDGELYCAEHISPPGDPAYALPPGYSPWHWQLQNVAGVCFLFLSLRVWRHAVSFLLRTHYSLMPRLSYSTLISFAPPLCPLLAVYCPSPETLTRCLGGYDDWETPLWGTSLGCEEWVFETWPAPERPLEHLCFQNRSANLFLIRRRGRYIGGICRNRSPFSRITLRLQSVISGEGRTPPRALISDIQPASVGTIFRPDLIVSKH